MSFVFDWNNDSNILNYENIFITDLSLDIPQQFCTRGVKAKDGEQLRCTLSGKKKKAQYLDLPVIIHPVITPLLLPVNLCKLKSMSFNVSHTLLY